MPNNQYLVYGGDMMLFTASGSTVQPIAFTTSAKISISMKTRDITSKDSGDFVEKMPTRMEWTASTDALVNLVSTGTTQSTDDLYNLMINKKLINVSFGQKTGTSPSWTVDTSKKRWTGQGYITSLDINSPSSDNATYSITIEGSGALTMS